MSGYSFGFQRGFQQGCAHEQIERERIAELNRPAPHNLNAPKLFSATKVRVLKPFCVGGESLEIGATVELHAHDAHSLAAIGKCEILN